jgi:hypothetical protein
MWAYPHFRTQDAGRKNALFILAHNPVASILSGKDEIVIYRVPRSKEAGLIGKQQKQIISPVPLGQGRIGYGI